MTRARSPAYPSFPLEKAIGMIAGIFEADRRNVIDRETAAKHIGYSGRSGAADKALATLTHYNLLEKYGTGQARVTQTAMDIIHPDSDEDKKSALLAAGMGPDIFNEIRGRFPGPPPSDSALTSWLVRENFQNRAIKPIVKSYTETHEYLERHHAFDMMGDFESEEAVTDGGNHPSQPGITMPQMPAPPPQMPGLPSQMPVPSPQMPTPSPQVLATGNHAPSPTTEHSGQTFPATTHPEATPRAAVASGTTPTTEDALNQINAEIRGDTVFISALLDKEGLKKLAKKIAALSDFLDDD